MSSGLSATLHTSFEEAVKRITQALADQGFGVLTTIDVKATLNQKLGEDMEDYLILGACNPALAHRALGIHRQIGQLLPCNVVVRTDPAAGGDTVLVEAMDPQIMVEVTGAPGALQEVADQAAAKLQAAMGALERSAATPQPPGFTFTPPAQRGDARRARVNPVVDCALRRPFRRRVVGTGAVPLVRAAFSAFGGARSGLVRFGFDV